MRLICLAALAAIALAIPDAIGPRSIAEPLVQRRGSPSPPRLFRRAPRAAPERPVSPHAPGVWREVRDNGHLLDAIEKHRLRWEKEGVPHGRRERDVKLMEEHLTPRLHGKEAGLTGHKAIHERVDGLARQVEAKREQQKGQKKQQRLAEQKPAALWIGRHNYQSIQVDTQHRKKFSKDPSFSGSRQGSGEAAPDPFRSPRS